MEGNSLNIDEKKAINDFQVTQNDQIALQMYVNSSTNKETSFLNHEFLIQLRGHYLELCQQYNLKQLIEDELDEIICIQRLFNEEFSSILEGKFLEMKVLNNLGKKKRAQLLIFYNQSKLKEFSDQYLKRIQSIGQNTPQIQQVVIDLKQSAFDSIKLDQTQQTKLKSSEEIQFNLIKQQILKQLESSYWIPMKLIDDFIDKVYNFISIQDWKEVKDLIEQFCFPKYVNQATQVILEQFNFVKEKKAKNTIVMQLQAIERYNQLTIDELNTFIQNLKQKGFGSQINENQIKQIFEIELKTPFICKQDPILLQLYFDKYSESNLNLTQSQRLTIIEFGFNDVQKLNSKFTLLEIDLLQNDIQNSIELENQINSLNPLRCIPRLNQLLKIMNESKKNILKEKDFIEQFIYSYDHLKVFSNDTLQHHVNFSSFEKQLNFFFSNNDFQNLYARFTVLSELKCSQERYYFKEILQLIKQLCETPEIFIEQWMSNNSKDFNEYQVMLFEEINLFNNQPINGLMMDIIKFLISEKRIQQYFIKKIFEKELSYFKLDTLDINELFEQFSQHGLNYYHQIENIHQIQQIERSLKESKLLRIIFGREFYDQSLMTRASYFNFTQLNEQASKLDRFFKQFTNKKMVNEDFMMYVHEDQYQIDTQIKQAVNLLNKSDEKSFIQIIFNLLIQLSKRNQDLSSVFQKLSSELLNINYPNNLINQKIFTEYLFMSVDKEVSQKLSYLLGYSNPIPLILSRPKSEKQSTEQIVMKNTYWLLSQQDNVIASLGFGYLRGKSLFNNDMFFTNFEVSNKSFIFQGSADIQSNKIFKTNKRNYFVVDFHGDCLEIHEKYLIGFYKYYIIQISHSFLKSEYFIKLVYICNQIDPSFQKICFVIRDYTESKPNFKEYFNLTSVRQKLNCEFFNNKQVILIPNLKYQERDDKNYIIEQSRLYIDQLITESSQFTRNVCRDLYSDKLLIPDDEEYLIQNHIQNICKKIIQSDVNQRTMFTVYPIFQNYSRLKHKLTRKHFLQNQDRELNYEETDLDRKFYDFDVKYSNFVINSESQRSQASKLFEDVICSKFNLHNSMNYFIKELKFVNQIRLQSLISQKKQILSDICKLTSSKNSDQKQMDSLKQKKQEIDEKIEDSSISVDILWREIIQHYLKHVNYHKNSDILCAYRHCIDSGFPFEIIDGENFFFPKQFLTDVFDCELFKNKKICVISIIGPQNSGKSTLLNYLLGCDFSVSDGRCTKGIYGTLIKSKFPEFDLILVIDTEGLQSLEKNDPEYDRKITLFCLTISHLVIINVKDQLTNDMLQLLEVCISARQNIESNTIQKPIIEIIFNQKADPNQNNADQAIDNAMRSLESNKLLSEIDASQENVTSLPSAVTCEVVSLGGEKQQQWRYLKTQVDFVEKVKQFGYKVINKLLKSINVLTNSSNCKNIIEDINQWIDLASAIYETIDLHPSLTAFKDIRQKQVDSKLKDYIKQEIDIHFNQIVSDYIEKETSNQNIRDAESFIQKLCEEKKDKILNGYDRVCKTFEFEIGDLQERNRNYINIQIDSFKINYMNDLKINKNTMRVYKILNESIYIFDKKVKDLKVYNVSLEEAEKEFEIVFSKEMDQIKNNIPKKEQTNKDAYQFVCDQYKRYYQHDLYIPRDINFGNMEKNNYNNSFLNQLKSLIQNKQIFYQFQNKENYVFTNKSFEKHLKEFKNSIINTEKLISYYNTSIQLIDIGFSVSKKLRSFTCQVLEYENRKQNYQPQNNYQKSDYYQNNTYQYTDYLNSWNQQQPFFEKQIVYQHNYIDDQKIFQYNQVLGILNLNLDQSFIESQILNNINNLTDKVKLRIQGKEEFIKIIDLKISKPIEELKQQFIKQINELGLFRECIKKVTNYFKKPKNKKIQIEYWKPFVNWIRTQLQKNMNQQDIVNIEQLVKGIKNNLMLKVKDKKVNEELIQSICGYVSDEIKKQEDLVEIFNIKFSKNFKSFIHSMALEILYKQESEMRSKQLYQPIQDFENKKDERKNTFLQKFEATNNINQSSAVIFNQFLKDFSIFHIENQLQKKVKQINESNEKTISRYDLQKKIEASLTAFNQDEAVIYIEQPQTLINKLIEERLQNEMDELNQIQINSIQILISSVNDVKNQLFYLNQNIEQQLNENYENDINNKDDANQILQRIHPQLENQQIQMSQFNLIQKIQDFNQNQTEEDKMKAYSYFIFNLLIGNQSDIMIDSTLYKVQLKIPELFQIQNKHLFLIEEFQKSNEFKKMQINNLSEFILSFVKYLNDLENFISSTNIIASKNIKEEISEFNQRIINCTAKCPCCDQSCDQDHWKFKGVPIGENENKHQSKSGHRFVAFKGVKIEYLDQPALILCSDYQETDIIIHKNQKMSWSTFKENNESWDWNFTQISDSIISRAKWSYLWKLVGRDICQQFGISNYIEAMTAEQINQYKKQQRNMHFIFAFDESGSMNGYNFYGLYQALVGFIGERINQMKQSFSKDICTLLGFDDKVHYYAQYEIITPQTINQIPTQNSGGGTSFKSAFNSISSILSQSREYDQNIVVVFLSDGEDSLPQEEINKLNYEYQGQIKQFLTIGFGNSNFDILKQIANQLKDGCGGKYLQSLDIQQLEQDFQKIAYIIPS